MMVIASQLLLYLCLSLLMGVMTAGAMPRGYMPRFRVPKWLLIAAAGGVIVFGAAPVFSIIMNMAGNLSFAGAFGQVLFGFNAGRAWLIMYLIAIVFIAFFAFDIMEGRAMARAGMALTVILAVAQSFGGHAFEQAGLWGVTVHAVHLTAVMVWSGLLMILGWFTREKVKWPAVLSWFTPLALISIIVLAVSGVFISDVVTAGQGAGVSIFRRLADSWLTDYGQSLLFKQLLLAAVLGFGIINGILYRAKLRLDPDLEIRPWIRAESFIVLIILMVTAFMGEQPIPSRLDTVIERDGVSSLFEAVHGAGIPAGTGVLFGFDAIGVLLILFAAVFFGFMLYAARMRMHAGLSFVMALCFVASAYLGLMLSIV